MGRTNNKVPKQLKVLINLTMKCLDEDLISGRPPLPLQGKEEVRRGKEEVRRGKEEVRRGKEEVRRGKEHFITLDHENLTQHFTENL